MPEQRTGVEVDRVAVVGRPSVGVAQQHVRGFEVFGLLGQPPRQLVPLAQEALQGDLDDGLPAGRGVAQITGVSNENAGVDQLFDQAPTGFGQVGPQCDAAHGLVAVADRRQPRDECLLELGQFTGPHAGVGRQDLVDLGLDDTTDAADLLVLPHRQFAGVAVVGVEPRQRPRQQRQGVAAPGDVISGIVEQSVHELRLDRQRKPALRRPTCRSLDHLPEPGRAHRSQIVEQFGVGAGELLGGLHRFVAVSPDRRGHNQSQRRRRGVFRGGEQVADQSEQVDRFRAGLGGEEFLGLIQRHNQRRSRGRVIGQLRRAQLAFEQ